MGASSWLEDDDLEDAEMKLSNILPKTGNYLGLDISKNSTGICLVSDGKITTGNITLSDEQVSIKNSDKWCFEEVLLRRYLKKYLLEAIGGMSFEVILIEDAFTGENPKVSRMLYALNTAIDEIILDGGCTCKKFRRVGNGSWKKWLFKSLDPEGYLTGFNDKIKIQRCLEKIGIDEGSSFGFQDRLDSTGILIGYFLNEDKILEEDSNSGIKITWSQIDFAFELDESFIYEDRKWLCDYPVVYIDMIRPTKKAILQEINKNPDSLHITKDMVSIGILADKMGVVDEGEGYLAFWVKKRLRKKLFGTAKVE